MDIDPMGRAERSEPETFRARSLSVSLTVADLEKSRAWYRDVMRFTVENEYEREGKLAGVVMIAGTVRILLNQDDGARGWDRTKGEGFSLHLSTAQDVDEYAARIEEAGGSLAMPPTDMPWGTRSFRIVDPDGFKLSIASEAVDGE